MRQFFWWLCAHFKSRPAPGSRADLIEKLNRWAEIAQNTHDKEDWDKCSLLHSFGDSLARDLKEAVRALKDTT